MGSPIEELHEESALLWLQEILLFPLKRKRLSSAGEKIKYPSTI